MSKKGLTTKIILRPRVQRLATFLLFFYLIGNLTVLEYFGGNPDLGILSYTQVAEPTITAETASFQNSSDRSRSSERENDSNDQLDGDDCLATCTHCILAVISMESDLIIHDEQVINQSTRHIHPDPHPTSFYRPPRTA